MQPISQDFAPPFNLIAPYFIIAGLVFFASSLFLFTIDVTSLSYLDPKVLSLIHLFLLGFIMMIIFGAMAQLIPVTLEVGHACVELYYVIWPLLLIGSFLMFLGFIYSPILLPFAGLTVLISMFIFLVEVFLTILKVKKYNNVIKSLIVSNIFLFLGLIVGVILSLAYAGLIIVDMSSLLKVHVFLLVLGYVVITIMALSLILLPMFGLSHNFSQKPLNLAVITTSIAVVFIFIANIFTIKYLEYLGFILSSIALFMFFYQVLLIYKTRARKEIDVYVYHLFFAFSSLLVSISLFLVYIYTFNEKVLLVSGFLLIFGFFSFVIIGHIYKILPFLVWFEKFAPLVGTKPVPMLADMVPLSAAKLSFSFLSIAVILISVSIFFESDLMFKSGVSFLVMGAIFVFKNLIYMIRFK